MKNIALIDGQNLHLGVKADKWRVDYKKLRIYLRDKYDIEEAYYFLGYFIDNNATLFDKLQKAGYIIKWRAYGNEEIISHKKGNVDTSIVFFGMREFIERDDFDKFLVISGDGDYREMIDYFIQKNRFEKILFPSRKRSSYYKKLGNKYFAYLSGIQSTVEHLKKEKGG